MFDRAKYKSFARTQLKSRMGIPIFMTLVLFILTVIIEIPIFRSIFSIYQSTILQGIPNSLELFEQSLREFQKSSIATLLAWLRLIVIVIVVMAQTHVYLKMSRSPDAVHASDFFEGFTLYLRALFAAMWQYIFIFLWTLLFVIPGIIKMIAYSQTNYIVAEFKNVPVLEALNISKKITKGHKWNLFILDLSFIPWYLLGYLTLGLAFLWITPYIRMTKINAYHALLKEAVENNIITTQELGY